MPRARAVSAAALPRASFRISEVLSPIMIICQARLIEVVCCYVGFILDLHSSSLTRTSYYWTVCL